MNDALVEQYVLEFNSLPLRGDALKAALDKLASDKAPKIADFTAIANRVSGATAKYKNKQPHSQRSKVLFNDASIPGGVLKVQTAYSESVWWTSH